MTESTTANDPNDVERKKEVEGNGAMEYILADIGGTYGKFQVVNYILYSIPLLVAGLIVMPYVFTAFNLDYR